MTELTAVASIVVAVVYILIGAVIMPRISADTLALIAAVAFFIGCALTHLHWGADLLLTADEPHGLRLMLALHLAQIIGGSIFLYKMSSQRLVIRLDD